MVARFARPLNQSEDELVDRNFSSRDFVTFFFLVKLTILQRNELQKLSEKPVCAR